MQFVHTVPLKTLPPEIEIKNLPFISDKIISMIPEALKETQSFDSQVMHINFKPIDLQVLLNWKLKCWSRLNEKNWNKKKTYNF